MTIIERWKAIQGYGGLYQVSNKGRIKSFQRGATNGRILSVGVSRGYQHVGLCKDGEQKTLKIHRLVAIHFIRNPKNYPQINHKNGVKTDNLVSNLEWCEASYNRKHAYSVGLIKTNGEKHPSNILTEAEAQAILNETTFNRYLGQQVDLAKRYGVTKQTVSYSVLKDRSFLLQRGCPWGRCLVIAEPRSGVLRWSYINHIPHRSDGLSIGVTSRSPYGTIVNIPQRNRNVKFIALYPQAKGRGFTA